MSVFGECLGITALLIGYITICAGAAIAILRCTEFIKSWINHRHRTRAKRKINYVDPRR